MTMNLGVVGYDPGANQAIAFLSLNLKTIFLFSSKNIDRPMLLSLISNYYIIAVATDKKQAPQSVKSLATSTGAKLYTPNYNLSLNEKRKLIEELSQESSQSFIITNQHELDALSSAYYCYKNFIKRINEKITNKLKREHKIIDDKDLYFIWKLVLANNNISNAIKELINQKTTIRELKTKPVRVNESRNKLQTKIKRLENELNIRDKAISLLKKHITLLRKKQLKKEKINHESRYIRRIRSLNKQIIELFDIIKHKDKEIERLRNRNIAYEIIESYKNGRKRRAR